jgi:alpha-D-ribose 1-methylphosphonate 5-triphosphate synthase subunit PhnL
LYWCPKIREENGIRLFENTVLRRIFGNMADAVTGEIKMIHNDKVNTLCSSTDTIRVIRSRRIGFVGNVLMGW